MKEFERVGGLNKANLQVIAIIAMVIDHSAFLMPTNFWYYTCKFIGRITIIIMCFFIAEGYCHTRDVRMYILRMAVFAAIAEIPFYLFEQYGKFPSDPISLIKSIYWHKNVIFTLLIGLCTLTALKSRINVLLKILAFCAAWKLSKSGDWRYFGILWTLAFGLFRGDTKKQLAAASLVILWRFFETVTPAIVMAVRTHIQSPAASVLTAVLQHINRAEPNYNAVYSASVQLGGFLALPLLRLYNGEKGNAPRLLFYIFYPAHLLLFFFLKAWLL